MNETQRKQITSREQEIVFTNFRDEEFEGKWNKNIYRIRAKASVYLPFFLAEAFANDIVQMELNEMAAREIAEIRKIDPRIDAKEIERREMAVLNNAKLRQELMDKCIEVVPESEVGYVRPKEVPVREVPLQTNIRSAEMVKEGRVSPSDLGPTNQPKEEKFEGLE